MEQQSTVEGRRKRFIEIYQSSVFDSSNNTGDKLFEYMDSEIQLAEQKAREEERHKIFKYLKANHILQNLKLIT